MDVNAKGFAHLKFLKEAAERSFNDLEAEIEARHAAELQKTENKLNSEITIHRVFASSPDGGAYCSIGWVVAKDVDNCMSCLTALQPNTIKHHCFACGNVVCSSCYSSEAFVVEIMQLGKVNVCSDCYQYGGNVKKTNNRRASRQSLSQNRGVSLLLTTDVSSYNDNGNNTTTTPYTPTTPYSDAHRIEDESELFAIVEDKKDEKAEPGAVAHQEEQQEIKAADENKHESDNEEEEEHDDTVPAASRFSCFFCFAF